MNKKPGCEKKNGVMRCRKVRKADKRRLAAQPRGARKNVFLTPGFTRYPTSSRGFLQGPSLRSGRGKDFLPTRANIERQFRRLAQVANAGDQVVIHMGGHGSQQPEKKDSPDPEPNGLDEVFLPRDVGAWNETTIKNAIIDDEIGSWLKAIRD